MPTERDIERLERRIEQLEAKLDRVIFLGAIAFGALLVLVRLSVG